MYKDIEDEISGWPDRQRKVCASSVKKPVITIEDDELRAGASSVSVLGGTKVGNPPNHKWKFINVIDVVPLREAAPTVEQISDDEMLCWSGPPKPPRSPIVCTQTMGVSDPVFRVPRQRVQMNNSKKSKTVQGPVRINPDVDDAVGNNTGRDKMHII